MPPPRDVKKQQTLCDDEKRVLADRYRVEKKLGSGNYGTAFLVTDMKENNELKVLKEVSIGEMQPDESIESVHEANLLSKLDNPYILKYHDSFLDGEYFCIVTEYCEGGDLDVRFKKLKKENKKLSEEQVLDWTVQLLSAVNYMHSRRVLHRDLKARNIFLKNEIVKIGDFGISRILQGTMDMASTFTGTPYYMSPEVLKHEGYNSKSDVWSIGCLLYEMCTFQHAFEGQGLMGVMYKIVEGKIPELPNGYSKELNEILKKIFRKDPSQRPTTSELLREPLIANHIKNMIKRLETSKLEDLESTMIVKKDRTEIAKAVNSKISLKELQSQRQTLPTVPEATSNTAAKSGNTSVKATPVVILAQPAPIITTTTVPITTTQVTPAAPVATKLNKNEIEIKKAVKSNSPIPVKKEDPVKLVQVNEEQFYNNQETLRPKTSGTINLNKPFASIGQDGKELTPKERLLLNKLKKADEEAAKVGQMAKENYEERILRDSFRREGTINLNIPKYNPKLTLQQAELEYEMQKMQSHPNTQVIPANTTILINNQAHITKEALRLGQTNEPHYYIIENADNSRSISLHDDEDGTLLKTLQYGMNLSSNNQNNSTQIIRKIASPQSSKINPYDTRPINPLKTKIEYAFDEDGIPLDPQITNEYYQNANDFEIDSSPERKTVGTSFSSNSITRNSMSKTIAPNRRRVTMSASPKKSASIKNSNDPLKQYRQESNLIASKTYSSSQPRGSAAARMEYEQLIHITNELENSRSGLTDTFGDDSRTSVFGAHTRATKIQNLRAQAIRRLGPETFDKCYAYLREQRRGPNSVEIDETKIFEGLKKYTSNPTDCFLVDQLLFLEES